MSDEDQDISIPQKKESDTQKALAEIDDAYNEPRVFEILVNHHVTIRVRRVVPEGPGDAVFIATLQSPYNQVKEVQFSKSADGKFTSEMLRIDTNNREKGDFRLDTVRVFVVDKKNKPLSIDVEPVQLKGGAPPRGFQIILPEDSRIANSEKRLEVSVEYRYRDTQKTSPSFQLSYITIIDTVYLALKKRPNQPIKDLAFSEDSNVRKFVSEQLIVESENTSKAEFQLNQLDIRILSKEGDELYLHPMSLVGFRIGEPFLIELPAKKEGLDWHGNQMNLTVDYQYNGVSKQLSIPAISYSLRRGFPTWIFVVLLLVVLGIAAYFLIRWLIDWLPGRPLPESETTIIVLTRVSASGSPQSEPRYFTVRHGDIVSFEQGEEGEFSFDVGCESYLFCDNGRIRFYQDDDDERGRSLSPPENLNLTNAQGDPVYVRFEVEEESTEEFDEGEFELDTSDESSYDGTRPSVLDH